MRWFVASVLALLIGWAGYLAAPYWALYGLAAAIDQGNVAEVAERINLRALRVSIARQVATDLAAADRGSTLAPSEAQLAASAVLALADPALDTVVTSEGLMDLLRRRPAGSRPDLPPSPFLLGLPSFDHALEYLAASSWRGFRNVYFSLPPGRAPVDRYRLQLRYSRLSWRLVSLELPAEMRRQIAANVRRRLDPTSR